MIGFKVIDTKGGTAYTNSMGKFAYAGPIYTNHNGLLIWDEIEDKYVWADRFYKAVPCITINGYECYLGQVFQDEEEYAVVNFGKYDHEMHDGMIGFYIKAESGKVYDITAIEFVDTSISNVWQPEYRHLLPLLEV